MSAQNAINNNPSGVAPDRRRVLKPQNFQNPSRLFEIDITDKKNLSNLLSISFSQINKLMAEEGLPYFKIGRSVRYRVSEVASWLELRRMS
jgi:predicted DNA-binding transcriptional regulator AlpA